MTGGMMFKGTPGPWKALEGKRGWQIHTDHVRGKGAANINHWIANIKCESCPAHEEDNANLISAAPELLDNGQFLLDRLSDFESDLEDDGVAREFYGHVSPAIANFRAAIAKALGEQK